ncbi:MAG: hypothetical protein RIC18_06590 [Hoeflea sp.]|uniref:hypothetical protein n=1 Tax=Hoeflea sp. TaxID=1940281 RepID=UPI0032EC183D
MKNALLGLACAFMLTAPLFAEETLGSGRVINEFEQGSVSTSEGLASWQTFYEVASHPRCSNCHVGADNRPMWSGPSYGETRVHGMNINAGESRIGAETLMCSTCHVTLSESDPDANPVPHAAPRVAAPWLLPPVEAEWFGKSSAYICNQLRDPARNGDRTIREVAAHLDHDQILHWAWNPGGTREPAPHSLQGVMDALMKWSAAGTPCPEE